jgi:signal transduction histidine kinase
MDQNKDISVVISNSLFKGVNDSSLNIHFNPKYFEEMGEGGIVYRSGEPSDFLYLIIEGEVKIKLPRSFSSPSLMIKTSGAFFGEKEILENCPRKSSAVANKNSLLYKIRKTDVSILIAEHQEIKFNLSGDFKEDFEAGSNKKDIAFNGLFENLPEQTLFKSEIIVPINEIKQEKPDLNTKTERETENQTDQDQKINTAEDEEGENETKYENNTDSNEELKIENPETHDDLSDNKTLAENSKSDPVLPFLTNALVKIFSDITPDEIFSTIPTAISELLGAEFGILYIIDKETNEFRTRTRMGMEYSDQVLKYSENFLAESVNEDRIINLTYPPQDQIENFITYPDTEIKSLIISPIKNASGRITGILILANSNKDKFDSCDEKLLSEISPLIALAFENSEFVQKLLNSDRLTSLSKIANFLIKDIKNPILTIKQYSEHIKKENVSQEVNLVLDMIVEQSSYVVELVHTTLGYSEGKLISNPKPILLSEALDYILFMLAEYVESRDVKLFKKIEGDGMVNMDKKEFYQACFQIAKNACDAMPKGGNLYISTKRDGENIRIEFKDNGFGIPDSIKGKIFEPFMTHGKKNQSGLGLAIAEKIIDEHNGMIWAESELGEGAIITIVLPALD